MNTSRYTSLFGRRGWKALVLLLSLGALHGCGGGGSDGGTNANPNGYYGVDGTAHVNNTDVTNVQGMIHDGQFVMLSDAARLAYHGTIAVSRSTFTGEVTVYENGVAVATQVPVAGMISEGQFIDGRLEGTGLGSGTFRLSYDSVANAVEVKNSDLFAVNWKSVSVSDFFSIVVDDDPSTNITYGFQPYLGTFDECNFSGRIDPVATHLYAVSVTMHHCTNVGIYSEPTYRGLATLRTENPTTPNDRLVFAISNGNYSVNGEFMP
ncbi:MAG: hypothetical protein AB1810_05250 [Pseudomonadota bacterium]